MTLLRVDITGGEPSPGHLDRLELAVAALPPTAPVVLMLHGYRYAVGHARHCPHDHIVSPVGGTGKSLSWPRHLGFRDPSATNGLAVAIGWPARGTIWAAHRSSAETAAGLAAILSRIHAICPARFVGAIGHSLGARVILQTLPLVAPGALDRAVLMSAAAFRSETAAALATPAGRAAEFLNVTSRENDLFDLMIEMLIAGGTEQSIGHGLGWADARWVDLQLDHPEVLRNLDRLGFSISPPARRICHWSPYRRPGVFAIYRALLTDPLRMPLSIFAGAAATQQGRWSRLLPSPRAALPLPFRRGAAS